MYATGMTARRPPVLSFPQIRSPDEKVSNLNARDIIWACSDSSIIALYKRTKDEQFGICLDHCPSNSHKHDQRSERARERSRRALHSRDFQRYPHTAVKHIFHVRSLHHFSTFPILTSARQISGVHSILPSCLTKDSTNKATPPEETQTYPPLPPFNVRPSPLCSRSICSCALLLLLLLHLLPSLPFSSTSLPYPVARQRLRHWILSKI